jgi:hypothetical protein
MKIQTHPRGRTMAGAIRPSKHDRAVSSDQALSIRDMGVSYGA